MRSRSSSVTTNNSGSVLTNDEIGISESSGGLGLSRAQELKLAIECLKKRVVEAETQHQLEQKALLIEKLIELRTELEDLTSEKSSGLRITRKLGHEFSHMPKSTESYCEQCLGQTWSSKNVAKCNFCGFFAHEKCLRSISKRCQGQGGNYVLEICPERGLHLQKYRCKDCRCKIAINTADARKGTAEARLCHYSGFYYCAACHWNDLRVIPGRIVKNWDFNEYPVARNSYRYLKSAEKRILVNIEKENDQLYSFVEELQQIRKLRDDILRMKVYLSCCSSATEKRLLLRLQDRQHFVESADGFTVQDLSDIYSGTLIDILAEIHADYAYHIKLDCLRCQAKGFICGICNNGNELFPFDAFVSNCGKCGAVYHKECFNPYANEKCPRCIRLAKKDRERTPSKPAQSLDQRSNSFI